MEARLWGISDHLKGHSQDSTRMMSGFFDVIPRCPMDDKRHPGSSVVSDSSSVANEPSDKPDADRDTPSGRCSEQRESSSGVFVGKNAATKSPTIGSSPAKADGSV